MALSSTPCKFNDDEDQTTIKSIGTLLYSSTPFLVKKCCQHVKILPTISGIFKNGDQLCLVLPDLSKSFTSFSIFKKGLPVELVAFVVMETLKALDCMHVRGERVHGSLHIKNLFFDKKGSVRIAFPTRLINPSQTIYPSNVDDNLMCDVKTVGLMALDLFYGEASEKRYFCCFSATKQKKLPKAFKDFIALSRGGHATVSGLMQHEFLSKFCEFDRCKEDFKKLISRKLTNK